jgi:hypothetical protein
LYVANCTFNWGAGTTSQVNSISWCKDGSITSALPQGFSPQAGWNVSCYDRGTGLCEHASFNDFYNAICTSGSVSLPPICQSGQSYKDICKNEGSGYICMLSSINATCRQSTYNYCWNENTSGIPGCTIAPSSTYPVWTNGSGNFNYIQCK